MAKQQQQAGITESSLPERLELAGNVLYRSASRDKDQRFLNCFQESIKNELTNSKKSYVVKRPGLSSVLQVVNGGVARGLIYWNGKYYSVIGNTIYSGTTTLQTFTTSTGKCGFKEFDNGGVYYLFVCDGIDAYVISTTNTVTQVNQIYSAWITATAYVVGDRRIPTVDNGFYYEVSAGSGNSGGTEPTWPLTIGATVVDSGLTWTCKGAYGGFPSPHIPTPEFVDGYMLLPRSGSADVHNCDVDNIYGWSAANFVTCEMFPDNVVSIARQNNQIVAFGTMSTEFLYDAAQTGGSPFARNEGAVIQSGCAAPYALYQNERFCVFVGQSESGGRAVWLIEGFQPKKVSIEPIERILDAEGTSLVSATGFGIRTKGHLFYILNLTSTSLVYDVEEKVWHEWTTNSNGSHTRFECSYATDPDNGAASLLHATNGTIYTLSPTVYTDHGVNILMDIYTAKYDGNTMNRKNMHNLNIIGDLVSTQSISLRWSDDDYTTWSNFKVIGLDTRPWFARLGSFRRRAFNLLYTGNSDYRAEALEFEIDIGTH